MNSLICTFARKKIINNIIVSEIFSVPVPCLYLEQIVLYLCASGLSAVC